MQTLLVSKLLISQPPFQTHEYTMASYTARYPEGKAELTANVAHSPVINRSGVSGGTVKEDPNAKGPERSVIEEEDDDDRSCALEQSPLSKNMTECDQSKKRSNIRPSPLSKQKQGNIKLAYHHP